MKVHEAIKLGKKLKRKVDDVELSFNVNGDLLLTDPFFSEDIILPKSQFKLDDELGNDWEPIEQN